MSKIQLFLLSLIGAGPAGFLTYLLCMYLIDQPTGANTMVMIFAILTVLCTAPLTLMPFLILALYYSNYDPPKIPKPSKKKEEDSDEEAEDLPDDEDDDAVSAKGKASKAKSARKADDDDLFDDSEEISEIEDDDQ